MKAVIFDLDGTLIQGGATSWLENKNWTFCNDDILEILELLKKEEILMFIASHNWNANQALKYLKIDHYFINVEGYSTGDPSKKMHLEKTCVILKGKNIPTNNCLFIDDVQMHVDLSICFGFHGFKVDNKYGVFKNDIIKFIS